MKKAASLLLALIMVFGMIGSVAAADSNVYYLIGTMTDWSVNADYQLTENPNAPGEYQITVDLPANAEFKVVKGNKETWYPDNAGNYAVSEAGNYTVSFRPDGQGGSDWYYGYFYVAKNVIPTYAITVTTDGHGTAVADKTAAQAGETVTVTIAPDEGYELDTVTGTPGTWNLSGNIGTFTMPAEAVALRVTFKEQHVPEEHRIHTIVTGEGTVTVAERATEGDTVTVTLMPAENYALRTLKVDGRDVTSAGVLSALSYSFVMPGYDITIEAVFDAVATGEHAIHVFVSGLGTAFADKTTAAEGATVSFTIENGIGYVFKQIVVNDIAQPMYQTWFTMPNADAIVYVYFDRVDYPITLNSGVQGTMNAIPRTNSAFAGTEVQVIVNANEDYDVKTLTVIETETNEPVDVKLKEKDGQTSIYTFTMPAASVTVTATYKKRATNGYYLLKGQGGNWTVDQIDGNDKFVDDLSVSGQMLLTTELFAGDEIKVVHVTKGAIDVWYPDGLDNQYHVTQNDTGAVTIYFRTSYYNEWSAFGGYFFVKRFENQYYLVNADNEVIRWDDHLYINKEFNANAIINDKNETIKGLYGSDHEHMVLTWRNSGEKLKVVKVANGTIAEWLPDGVSNAYPEWITPNSTQDKMHYGAQNSAGRYGVFEGMVFVFFEEQIGHVYGTDNVLRSDRIDWTNNVFDVQKAFKADAADKSTVNPLNAESLTYNLAHGSISLSTGTPFIREGRSDEGSIPEAMSNIIYELGLNQEVYVSILAEAGYALDGTPYITYGNARADMTKDGDRWYFTMPRADVVIHAPMKKVFRTQSVLLSGQIGVNFFVDLSAYTDEEKHNCRMKFTVGKDSEPQWADFDSDFHSTITPTNYGFTCFVNAIQMADEITAKLYYGNEEISYKHYSLEEYVKYFDRSDSTQNNNVEALRVIRAMIDFGYYAQQYFKELNASLFDEYTEVKRYYATQYDFASIKRMTEGHSLKNAENVDLGTSDIDSLSASIAVDSATALIVYLTMKSGTTSTPEIKVGAQTLSMSNPEVKNGSFTWKLTDEFSGSTRKYAVRIEGISPHNLDKRFTIKGTAGSNFTIKASTFSYIDLVLSSESVSNEMKMLVASMYAFHEAEVAYRNQSN